MKKNFCVALKDLEGKDIVQDGQPALIKHVVAQALLAPMQDDKDGAIKVKKYHLAMKIYNAETEVEVSTEDLALLKKVAGETLSVLAVGQLYQLIEGE